MHVPPNDTAPAVPPFHCVGCGACCKGRFIPLTLGEAQQWLQRGHDMVVLLEAFEASAWEQSPEAFAYNVQRSAPVQCGGHGLHVTAIFAGQAIPRCPNLMDDDLCSIYADRPQVCRIYPMEINPYIPMRVSNKECPPDAWGDHVLATDRAADTELDLAIETSRQADRADAVHKVALCQELGMTATAWKGNGFAIYFPARDVLLQAIQRLPATPALPPGTPWQLRVSDEGVRAKLAPLALAFDERETPDYLFHALAKAD